MTLTERVRGRLVALKQEKRWKRKDVAARLGVDGSAVSRIVTNKDITLAQLEAIATEAGVEPAELVAPPGTLKQVNAEEAELLRYWRAWPKSVSQALLAFLRYFADESPAETQTRNVHEFWRGLNTRDRGWIFGILQMVREGILTPDLREGLTDRAIEALQQRRGGRAKRRETDEA
jgi:transcriptional regulator with XRE-family HTH domain